MRTDAAMNSKAGAMQLRADAGVASKAETMQLRTDAGLASKAQAMPLNFWPVAPLMARKDPSVKFFAVVVHLGLWVITLVMISVLYDKRDKVDKVDDENLDEKYVRRGLISNLEVVFWLVVITITAALVAFFASFCLYDTDVNDHDKPPARRSNWFRRSRLGNFVVINGFFMLLTSSAAMILGVLVFVQGLVLWGVKERAASDNDAVWSATHVADNTNKDVDQILELATLALTFGAMATAMLRRNVYSLVRFRMVDTVLTELQDTKIKTVSV